MVGTSLLIASSDQWAAKVASWFQERWRENLYKLATIPRSYRQGYGPIQAELFVPFLSPPCLHFQGSGSSTLPLSFLLLTLRVRMLFTSFSSSPCSRCYYLSDALAPDPCVLSLSCWFCHVRAYNLHAVCFLPEFLSILVAFMLSMCNKTTTCFCHCACPLCSRWTHRHMVRWTSAEQTNVELAHARPQYDFHDYMQSSCKLA